MTSSPGPIPSALRATCSADVPDEVLIANLLPCHAANFLSNSMPLGPVQ